MKKILILTNPYSGGKKGKKILNNILDIFSKIPYDLITSKYKNHPYEIVRNMNFEEFSGICIIGGDGTMHEVINGMLSRKDEAQLPIGLIPGGTGNSFMHDMNCLSPVAAAEKISHLQTREIDIMEVTTNTQTVFAYNVAGWGMPPDINILSEKIRWLGFQRYNIASLIEIMKSKERRSNLIINNKNISDDYSFILCCNTIHTGRGMKIAPDAKVDDGLMDVIAVKKTTRLKLFQLFPKIFSGKHTSDPIVSYYQVNNISIKPEIDSPLIIDGEIIGKTPCQINISPKKIDIFN